VLNVAKAFRFADLVGVARNVAQAIVQSFYARRRADSINGSIQRQIKVLSQAEFAKRVATKT
jgi:hypothetical protein